MSAITLAVTERDNLRRHADQTERDADRAAAEGDNNYAKAADLQSKAFTMREEVKRYDTLIAGLGGEPKRKPAISVPFKKKASA